MRKRISTLGMFIISIHCYQCHALEVSSEQTNPSTTTQVQIASKRVTQPSQYSSTPLLQPAAINTLIDLNKADSQTLQQLPHIGPKRSEKIINYRESLPNKQFTSIQQLLKIQGISPKTVDRLKAYVIIENVDD